MFRSTAIIVLIAVCLVICTGCTTDVTRTLRFSSHTDYQYGVSYQLQVDCLLTDYMNVMGGAIDVEGYKSFRKSYPQDKFSYFAGLLDKGTVIQIKKVKYIWNPDIGYYTEPWALICTGPFAGKLCNLYFISTYIRVEGIDICNSDPAFLVKCPPVSVEKGD